MTRAGLAATLLGGSLALIICGQAVLRVGSNRPPSSELDDRDEWKYPGTPVVVMHKGRDRRFVSRSKTASAVKLLQTGHIGLEAELRAGKWLVLGVPSNSVNPNDRLLENCIFTIHRIVGPQVGVALRPIEGEQDFCAWLPERCQAIIDGMRSASPVWLVLQDGKLLEVYGGLMRPSDVKAFVTDLKKPVGPW